MKRVYTPMHVLAIIAGLVCLGVDWYSNIEFIYAQTKSYLDSSVMAVVAVGFGGTVALSCAYKAFRQKAVLSMVMLFVGFFIAACFSITATMDRVSTQRDSAITERLSKDAEYQRLLKVRDRMNYIATREKFEGDPKTGRRAGKGDAYSSAKTEENITIDLMNKRKTDLDSGAQRIAAMIPFISVEIAAMYQPVLLPFALFILANWLVAFGINGERKPKEFNVELTGKDAELAKLSRYVSEYKKINGKMPSKKEISNTFGVSMYVAGNMLAKVS